MRHPVSAWPGTRKPSAATRSDVRTALRALAAGPAEDAGAAARNRVRQPRRERGEVSRTAAIDYYGRRIAHRELKREVDALAGFLQQRCGVGRGERVLLYLQNSPQFVIAYYAILRADAVVVPVNPMNRAGELSHYVQDSQARVAFVGQDVLKHIAPLGLERLIVARYADYLPARIDLPLPDFLRAACDSRVWVEAIEAGVAPGPHAAGPDDLAVMPYTSGTTGKPRGCMHTHSSVQATTVPYLNWRGAQKAPSCSARCRCSMSPACRPA